MKQDTIETRLTAIENKLDQLLSQREEILDLNGFCELAHLPRSTGYRLSKSVPHFKRGKRLYYKRSDIIAWLTANKRMSVDEMMSLATESVVNGVKTCE